MSSEAINWNPVEAGVGWPSSWLNNADATIKPIQISRPARANLVDQFRSEHCSLDSAARRRNGAIRTETRLGLQTVQGVHKFLFNAQSGPRPKTAMFQTA